MRQPCVAQEINQIEPSTVQGRCQRDFARRSSHAQATERGSSDSAVVVAQQHPNLSSCTFRSGHDRTYSS